MDKKTLELKLKDFIPVYGLYNFLERNKNIIDEEEFDFGIKDYLFEIYHLPTIGLASVIYYGVPDFKQNF